MENIKNHFEQEAHEFDEIILKLIPYYPQMLDALMTNIPFPKDKSIKVIDLGCGTGTISKQIKENYPSANIHCVDIADNMLRIAQDKLSGYDDITYENADLSKYAFTESYDAVVISIASGILPEVHNLWAS
jgi:tRNA (cmo5U34)-methyltransferase